jgi:hypothetical protein
LNGGVGTFKNFSRETSARQSDSSDQLEVGFAAKGEAVDGSLVGARVQIGDVFMDEGQQRFSNSRLAVSQENDALAESKLFPLKVQHNDIQHKDVQHNNTQLTNN